MTRQEFIRACRVLGLGIPFYNFSGFASQPKPSTFSGKVIIIGAGAAGLSAGHLLKQRGIDFTILEASTQFGGRMKINESFADFPIPLGAEWISSENIDFSTLTENDEVLQRIKTVGYSPDNVYWVWDGRKLLRNTLNTFIDKKFVNSSWFDFFKAFVVPSIDDNIIYNTKITSMDYTKKEVSVQSDQEVFTADKVIITTPLSILKKEINFSPNLPDEKRSTFDKATYWDGFKAFFEFKQKFYPSFVDYIIQPETGGQVSLYDAAWGQESKKHILGLFSVGAPAKKYGDLTNEAFKTQFMEELDKIFDGKASKNYVKYITQNWSKEPFAKGAYVSDFTEPKTIAKLQKPVEGKLYFAGDAYTDGTDWGNVHNAIRSASQCVETLLNN